MFKKKKGPGIKPRPKAVVRGQNEAPPGPPPSVAQAEEQPAESSVQSDQALPESSTTTEKPAPLSPQLSRQPSEPQLSQPTPTESSTTAQQDPSIENPVPLAIESTPAGTIPAASAPPRIQQDPAETNARHSTLSSLNVSNGPDAPPGASAAIQKPPQPTVTSPNISANTPGAREPLLPTEPSQGTSTVQASRRSFIPDSAQGETSGQDHGRPRAGPQTTQAGTGRPSPRPPSQDAVPPRQQATPQSTDDSQIAQGGQSTQPKAKRPTKRKRPAPQQGQGTAAQDETAESDRQPKRRRQRRSLTPDDAEERLIDPRTLTMGDLTKDLRIGKKSAHHDKLRDREREERRKRVETLSKASESPAPAAEQEAPAPGPQARTGPSYRIENGRVILENNSLLLDRHQRDAADIDLPEAEEDAFSRKVTSNSFRKPSSKLTGPNVWNEDDTNKFFQVLSWEGTDFTMVAKHFPGRTRIHAKKKYNREDKLNPARVTAAHKAHLNMNGAAATEMAARHESITRASGEMVPTDEIMKELRDHQAQMEQEHRAKQEEVDKINRQRRAEITGEPLEEEQGEGADKNGEGGTVEMEG